MFNKKKKNNKGFTLVELLVVIAIIGILAVVAVPSLMKNIEKSKVAAIESYINAAKTAAISVYADNEGSSVSKDDVLPLIDGKAPEGVSLKSATTTTNGVNVTIIVNNESVRTTLQDKYDGSVDVDPSITIVDK